MALEPALSGGNHATLAMLSAEKDELMRELQQAALTPGEIQQLRSLIAARKDGTPRVEITTWPVAPPPRLRDRFPWSVVHRTAHDVWVD